MSFLTPYLDGRPDISTLWTVRIEGSQAELPVLLSNGRLVQQGKLPGGRHFVVYKDPRRKPSYQVALVAGKLAVKHDVFHSCLTGSPVELSIYAPPALMGQLDFAMHTAKAAMAWHESAWGLPYKQVSARWLVASLLASSGA
jgi:aminopeptidase N